MFLKYKYMYIININLKYLTENYFCFNYYDKKFNKIKQ